MEDKAGDLDLTYEDIQLKHEIDDNNSSGEDDDDESDLGGVESFNYNQGEDEEEGDEKSSPSSDDSSTSSSGSNWSDSETQKLEQPRQPKRKRARVPNLQRQQVHTKLKHSTTTTKAADSNSTDKTCCRFCGTKFKDIATLNKHTSKLHPSSSETNESAKERKRRERLAKHAAKNRLRRLNESPEARAVRLAKKREYGHTVRNVRRIAAETALVLQTPDIVPINCAFCTRVFKDVPSANKHASKAHASSLWESEESRKAELAAKAREAQAKFNLTTKLRELNDPLEKAARLAKMREYRKRKREEAEAKAIEQLKRDNMI